MITYLSLFLMLTALSVFEHKYSNRIAIDAISCKKVSLIAILFLIFFVGLRDEVGGDWNSYLYIYNHSLDKSLGIILKSNDPLYDMLNMISRYYSLGIYAVNFACAFMCLSFLYYFLLHQENFFSGLIAAFPYLIVVVFMGYTRQSVAIGWFLILLLSIDKKSPMGAISSIFIGSLFHSSLVIFFPLLLCIRGLSKFKKFFYASLAFLWFLYITKGVLFHAVNNYMPDLSLYISKLFDLEPGSNFTVISSQSSNFVSKGGLFRQIINVMNGAALLLFSKKLFLKKVYLKPLLLLSILLLIINFFISTFADRLGLYLTVLPIILASNYKHLNISNYSFRKGSILTGIIVFHFISLLYWIAFSKYAKYWIPYKNILFRYIEFW